MMLSLALVACTTELPIPPGAGAAPVVSEQPTQTDVIVQTPSAKVDVLWAVDRALVGQHLALGTHFPVFLEPFVESGRDVHIGVISTDLDDGALRSAQGFRYLDGDTPQPDAVFASMLAALGATPPSSDQGVGAVWLALEQQADTHNAGFYRDDAVLHTVVVSSAPDATAAVLMPLGELIDWYSALGTSFSCIAPPGAACGSVTAEVGGLEADVADPDWERLMGPLSEQAAGLTREYFLSRVPVAGTIDVTIRDGEDVFEFDEDDWTWDPVRNSITFVHFLPAALSEVVIHYVPLDDVQGE